MLKVIGYSSWVKYRWQQRLKKIQRMRRDLLTSFEPANHKNLLVRIAETASIPGSLVITDTPIYVFTKKALAKKWSRGARENQYTKADDFFRD